MELLTDRTDPLTEVPAALALTLEETQPDPTPSPQPDPTPTVQPDPTPSPQPDPTPTIQPDPTPSPQPDPTPTIQPDPTPTPQPDPTPTTQPDPTPAPTPVTQSWARSGTPATAELSVVLVNHNEGDLLVRTLESFLQDLPESAELIVVDDLSTDGSADSAAALDPRIRILRSPGRLGVARARNLGASCATGEVLVFSDSHVEVPREWWKPLLEALSAPGVGAVGPVVCSMEERTCRGHGFRWKDPELNIQWLGRSSDEPYPVPFLVGCFTAMPRLVFEAVGGFDDGMEVWGSEDTEMSLRLWSLGYECRLVPGLEVAHLFRKKHPYAVAWETVLHNSLRLGVVHFKPERLQRMVDPMTRNAAFPAAFARLAIGDAGSRRARLHERRVRDDDWFFQRFGMEW